MIAEYLNAVLEEGDNEDVITAIGHVAKAIGMTKIATETGMSRPSLYKALSDWLKTSVWNNYEGLKSNCRSDKNKPLPAWGKRPTTYYKLNAAIW